MSEQTPHEPKPDEEDCLVPPGLALLDYQLVTYILGGIRARIAHGDPATAVVEDAIEEAFTHAINAQRRQATEQPR